MIIVAGGSYGLVEMIVYGHSGYKNKKLKPNNMTASRYMAINVLKNTSLKCKIQHMNYIHVQ